MVTDPCIEHYAVNTYRYRSVYWTLHCKRLPLPIRFLNITVSTPVIADPFIEHNTVKTVNSLSVYW